MNTPTDNFEFSLSEDYITWQYLKQERIVNSEAQAKDFATAPKSVKAAVQTLYKFYTGANNSNDNLKLQLRDVVLENRCLSNKVNEQQAKAKALETQLEKAKLSDHHLKIQIQELQKQIRVAKNEVKHLNLTLESMKGANAREMARLRNQTEKLKNLRLAQMSPKVQSFYSGLAVVPTSNIKQEIPTIQTHNQSIIVALREKIRVIASDLETCLTSLGQTPILSVNSDDMANPVILANELEVAEILLKQLMEFAALSKNVNKSEGSLEVQQLQDKLRLLLKLYHKTLALVESQGPNCSGPDWPMYEPSSLDLDSADDMVTSLDLNSV